jgi:hypothetical protein
MRFTYIASANNTTATATLSDGSTLSTAGQPLGNVGQDVYVYKIIVGLPVSAGNIVLKNKAVAMAFATDTSDTALKITLPTYSTTNVLLSMREQVIDFGNSPLQLDGGNVQIDQTMQVTVLWEFVSEAREG